MFSTRPECLMFSSGPPTRVPPSPPPAQVKICKKSWTLNCESRSSSLATENIILLLSHKILLEFNPLTPLPPVTAHDEPWPFFHFRRHPFLSNLASSILNFYRRKRSFQWCQDQSDQLSDQICTKVLKKMSEKLGAKFPATTPSCCMVKIGCLDDSFLEVFFNCKQAQEKVNPWREKKRKKGKEKKNQKSKSLKT